MYAYNPFCTDPNGYFDTWPLCLCRVEGDERVIWCPYQTKFTLDAICAAYIEGIITYIFIYYENVHVRMVESTRRCHTIHAPLHRSVVVAVIRWRNNVILIRNKQKDNVECIEQFRKDSNCLIILEVYMRCSAQQAVQISMAMADGDTSFK